MSSTPVFYVLKPERVEPASQAVSWLGRIVQNHAAPDAAFTPSNPSKLLADIAVSETRVAEASVFLNSEAASKLKLQLTGLASVFQDRGRGTGIQFSTTSIRYVRMQNHDKALRALWTDAGVRDDLGHMLKPGGDPAFFIVGFLIWENATFTDHGAVSAGGGGSVELPVSAVVASQTGLVLPDINPAIKLQSSQEQRRTLAGFSEGSSIFAFEYRTVRRRLYSITKNFTPRLGGYGGRFEKDRVFGVPGSPQRSRDPTPERPDESPLEMDDEDTPWVDLVDDEVEVEDVGDLQLAC